MSESVLFAGQRAYAHLSHLAVEIGSRLGGSAQEKRAADDIEAYFRSLGLVTRQQSFPVRTYGRIESRVEILEPDLGPIACEMMYLGQDSPAEGVTGEILFLPDGGNVLSIGPEVAGKILLVLGGLDREARERALRYRPLAVINIDGSVGKPMGHAKLSLETRNKLGALTEVRIAHDDGLRLVRAGAKRARVVARSMEADATSQDVIGELKGSVYPEEIVVICGHYDSVLDISGASDNAGGTAVMMELARVFAQLGSKRTLRFMAMGAEELGLRGSTAYVKALKAGDRVAREEASFVPERDRTELDQHVFCINIDIQGAVLGSNEAWVAGPADLGAAVRLLSKENGPAFRTVEEVYSSDSAPLSEAGVPSVSFARMGAATAYLHGPLDTVEWLGPEALAIHGRFIERFMRRWVTDARALAFERKIPDDMAKKMRDYFERRVGKEYWADDKK
jgi:aminopeptidase YwaD